MTINSQTAVCGIIGKPVRHSLSPIIHNAAAKHCKVNAVFVAFETDDYKGAISAMRALNIRELTITMPYKELIIPYLDSIEKQAEIVHNVNTVINTNGHLRGYNTDIDGIGLALKGIRVRGKTVALFGAGGAAKTIAHFIVKKGGNLHIVNRDVQEARALSKKYGIKYSTLDTDIRALFSQIKPSIVINATPVGMGLFRGKSLVPFSALRARMTVFDLIYNPLQTQFLKNARRAGCVCINGSMMFLGQGASQFELWSGKKAPFKIMQKAFDLQVKKLNYGTTKEKNINR
jgi:shikimate dehydrogenase